MNTPFVLPDIDIAAARIVTATIEGILEEEDIATLLNGKQGAAPAGAIVPSELKEPGNIARIKERHHGVARLIASGMSQRLVASITNYTEAYLVVLLNSPAMEELVALYRMQHGKSAEVLTEKLRTVGGAALDRLADRMEDLDDTTLVSVAKLGLDRSGHGPATTQKIQQETHFIDHAELARLNQEARRRNQEFITPVRDVRAALPAPKKGESDEYPDDEAE
jgi:hypothetical protein